MSTIPSRLSLWLGLTRPRTLLSALSSVMVCVAYALSLGEVSWPRVLLLALIAISAQIASNIANDLIDYRKGADTEARQGPMRPLSRGLLTEREVLVALSLSLVVLVASGIALIASTTWWLSVVGLSVVVGLFAYSGGPYPLAYHGLGDVAVLVFFGWVPVVAGFYVLTGEVWDATLWHLATSIGLASVNILVVNNYRDYDEDRQVGKRTLIVRLGRDFAPRLYLACGMLSLLLLYPIYSAWGMLLLLPYGGMMLRAYRSLQTRQGAELNATLGATARNVFFLALLISLMLWLR